MLHQAILPFKLERTDEMITPRSGLVLFAELVRAFKVEQRVERSFPRPGSNRGYEAWSYVEPSLSTFGDWLARAGAEGGSTAMGVVNEEVARTVLLEMVS